MDRSIQCENNLIESYLRITSVESLLAVHNAGTQRATRWEKRIDQREKEKERERECVWSGDWMKEKEKEKAAGKLKIEQWTNTWQPEWPPPFGRFDFADSDGSYALTWWYLNKLSIALKATSPATREAREPAARGGGRETGKPEAWGPGRSWKWDEASRAIKQISNFPFFQTGRRTNVPRFILGKLGFYLRYAGHSTFVKSL